MFSKSVRSFSNCTCSGCAISHAVSHWHLIAETEVYSQVSIVGVVVFSVCFGFSISIVPLLLHIHTCIVWGIVSGPEENEF